IYQVVGENVGEEIQDEFKLPSKRLKKDEPEKMPEPTEASLTEVDEEVSDKSSLKPLKILSTGSFIDLRKGGGYYLDKTHFISKIEDFNVRAILSLRPRRFGKTLFLSTLSSYYDIKNREQFKQIFELGRYSQVIDENADALANFLRLLKAVQSSGHKLYVFIDEYDASMNEALRNETILQSSQQGNRLKTACDKGIARVFQTGVTPVVMAEFTSGFNISADLALREEFWDLYGFKKSD
ncbi:4308_t:CDS:2, partial [Cetraspora pellucida]